MKEAIEYAEENGVIVIACGGNYGDSRPSPDSIPGKYNTTLAVGNIRKDDSISPSSSFNELIDIVAPGTDILSTTLENKYEEYSGCSMATPHVSAIVAIMLQVDPDLKPQDIREILKKTSTDMGSPGKDNSFGYGKLNTLGALNEIYSLAKLIQISLLIAIVISLI